MLPLSPPLPLLPHVLLPLASSLSDSLVGLAAAATSIASVMVHAHSSVELASLDMLHKVSGPGRAEGAFQHSKAVTLCLLHSLSRNITHSLPSPRPCCLDYNCHPCLSHPQVTAVFGDWIGALTLTGSFVAFGKLHGVMSSSALNLPGEMVIGVVCDDREG